jgi:hypothetical protein
VLCAMCGWRGKRKAVIDSREYVVRTDYGNCCSCHHDTLYDAKEWAEALRKMRDDEAQSGGTSNG